ncbi:DUF421 domain-containing protein [Actinospongicola halichondriae]|uniref:DUF421 domain-containing protein n=1 Tax=Actinospongicola halichondriae TaxID=3236844 RepID=UPI003D3BF5BF
MTERWLSTDLHQAWLVVVSAVAIFVAVVVVARIVGLRAFSKMSSFDFAVTVATGSVMASVAASSTSLANGVLALVVLYACQWIVAQLRRRTRSAADLVDNQPVVLMLEGEFIAENLTSSRVTEADVYAKLREANVRRMADVRVVVLETTGEVSVLHGDGPVDEAILADVRGFDPTQTDAVRARQSDEG